MRKVFKLPIIKFYAGNVPLFFLVKAKERERERESSIERMNRSI